MTRIRAARRVHELRWGVRGACVALMLGISIGLAGCVVGESGGPDAYVPEDHPGSSTPDAHVPDSRPGPRGPEEGTTTTDAELAWLPAGPSSPSDPPEQNWYPLLANLDCAALGELVRAQDFPTDPWPAAAIVCDAMTSGDSEAWDAAKTAVDALGAPPAGDDGSSCFGATVHRALQRAIRFHEDNPTIEAIRLVSSEGTACPLSLVGLSAESPTGEELLCGDSWFLLLGRLLPSTLVTVDGSDEGLELTVAGPADRLYIRMPAGEPGAESIVEARRPDGELIGSVSYTHPDPTICPTGTADPPTTDSSNGGVEEDEVEDDDGTP